MSRYAEERPKVKVLFLAANPVTTRRLAIDEEMREIAQKVRASEHRDMLTFQSAWAVRPDDLLQLLNQHQPDVVHFSGHGSEHGLCLATADGMSQLVTIPVLKRLFEICKGNIRLVFLNSCSSRAQAQALLETVDCVIGMRESIHDTASTVFSSSFYRAIGFGKSIQNAFDQGITSLQLEEIEEEDIPELLVKEGVDAKAVIFIPASDASDEMPSKQSHEEEEPVWNIPYARNPVFTGREQILINLAEAFNRNQSVALSQSQAISGLGGIGKTQIAVEYAYQHIQYYHAVLWVLADTYESLVSGYVTIATLLHIPMKEEQQEQETIQAVKAWLSTHTQWLLLVDNADDLTIVRDFLPAKPSGHILLTTRAQSMGRLAKHIEVDTMSLDSGALLLLRRAAILNETDKLGKADPIMIVTAREISEELGGLPLALDQAGAYIEETQCSLSDYQHLYRTRRKEMLKERGGLVADHPEAVATTWSLSFAKVKQKNPAASDLLLFCAYLAPDGIPETLITTSGDHLGHLLQPVASDPLAFNVLIQALLAYSLIHRETNEKTISIHRLVQAVIQDELPIEERENWMQRAVSAVDTSFPDPSNVLQWTACEHWFPHALICAKWITQNKIMSDESAHLLNHMAYYMHSRGQYENAELLYTQALEIYELQLGVDHPHTESILNNLAELYRAQGKYTKAEPLYLRALAICEAQLGLDHPSTAMSLNNLALLYDHQGRFEEAEPLYLQAVATFEHQLGAVHPHTAMSLNNLAGLYDEQGKYTKAEPLYLRALAIREEQLGINHPDIAQSLNNLASLYQEQGKYTEAEPLYLQALTICEEQLGVDHPDTAISLDNLANLYHRQAKLEEAELLCQRALAIREKQLGASHPNTAVSLDNLAGLYIDQGKYNEAEPLYLRALTIKEKQLGADHPNTANSLTNLAQLYIDQGKYNKAEPLYLRALTIKEKQLGANHPDVSHILNNLAGFYFTYGREKEAIPLFQRALDIRENTLGSGHPDTALSLYCLAIIAQKHRQYQKAESLYIRALTICEHQLGVEHPHTQSIQQSYVSLVQTREREKRRPL